MESPFSFHCRCCIEWFHMEKRYPVVLPCGHTYLCNECAERLETCMECRTPLYEIVSPPTTGPKNNQASTVVAGRRYQSSQPQPQKKPQPPVKKRLPLPKNLVLMSLIEATELAARNVRAHQQQEPSLTDSPITSLTSGPVSSMVDDEVEEEKIKTGTSLAISDCGTYAVAAKGGLEIFPSRPITAVRKEEEEPEEDVDTLVRFFHLEHKLDSEQGGSSQEEKSVAPPARLSVGDRVQIVSIDAGWAKLSRGYGYVKADGLQLVKVGGSVDRACKLEALLRNLSNRRKELRIEQVKMDNDFIALMNELQASLLADEDLTVIVADTFENNDIIAEEKKTQGLLEDDLPRTTLKPRPEERSAPPPPMEVEERETPVSENKPPPQEVDDHIKEEYDSPVKPSPTERPASPPPYELDSSPFFCGTPDVFGVGVLPYYSHLLSLPGSSPSNHSSVTPRIEDGSRLNPPSMPNTGQRLSSNALALRDGARAWRARNGRSASRNVGGIDFRTGMSGHTALNSSSANPHLGGSGRTSFRMSDHAGLNI